MKKRMIDQKKINIPDRSSLSMESSTNNVQLVPDLIHTYANNDNTDNDSETKSSASNQIVPDMIQSRHENDRVITAVSTKKKVMTKEKSDHHIKSSTFCRNNSTSTKLKNKQQQMIMYLKWISQFLYFCEIKEHVV